ncbi:MAG: hypothetical protein LBR29_05730 [Methylobacteriaceae bacterium]|nr:hypothetical protein [Methylobacteriaceae bacterium]
MQPESAGEELLADSDVNEAIAAENTDVLEQAAESEEGDALAEAAKSDEAPAETVWDEADAAAGEQADVAALSSEEIPQAGTNFGAPPPPAGSGRVGTLLLSVVAGVVGGVLTVFFLTPAAPRIEAAQVPSVEQQHINGLVSQLQDRVQNLEGIVHPAGDLPNRFIALETNFNNLNASYDALNGDHGYYVNEFAAHFLQTDKNVEELGKRVGDIENALGIISGGAPQAEGQGSPGGIILALAEQQAIQTRELAKQTEELAQNAAAAQSAAVQAQEAATVASLAQAEGARNVTLLLLADRLDQRVAQGQPYADIVGQLAAAGLADADRAALEPFAESGVPSDKQLSGELAELLQKVAKPEEPKSDDWTAKLFSLSDAVVQSYPKNTSGAGSSAQVSAVQQALTAGNLPEALKLWQSVPSDYQAVGGDWQKRVEQVQLARSTSRRLAQDTAQAVLFSQSK